MSFLFVAFAASAEPITPESGTMNPFAYDLKSEFDEENMQLDFEFKINAPFKKGKVYAVEVDNKNNKYLLAEIQSVTDPAAFPKYCKYDDINLIDKGLPMGKDFTWCVEVEALNEHTDVRLVSNQYRLYSPTSVDIDNNPENENFGTVFVVEGLPTAKNNATYANYISYTDGAGLYVFNADGTPRPIPNQGDKVRYGYNGGANRVNQDPDEFSYIDNNGVTNYKTTYSPYRVRVSDDGRIFVSSLTPDGQVLWEVDQRVFSRPNDSKWVTYTAWSRVIAAARPGHPNENANTYLRSGNSETDDTGNLFTASTGGNFIAGPNVSFDVRGAGDQLQLLMLSGSKRAIGYTVPSKYRCDEYNLGTNSKWEKAPTKQNIFNGGYVVNYQGTTVLYDKKGDVWLCQMRYRTDYPTLMKFSGGAAKEIDNPRHDYRRCGAIRFNEDFTKFARASKGTGSGGALTLYSVDSEGNPIWTNGVEYDMVTQTGYSHMDYAWDYADNLYVACDAYNGRYIATYAMPNTGRATVSTPCASKYAFSTKYSVAWKNLFLYEQDIADDTKNYRFPENSNTKIDYAGTNNRLWRLLQVGYNRYCSSNGKSAREDFESVSTTTAQLNVSSFFTINDGVVYDFFTKDSYFSWLGDYFSKISGVNLSTIAMCAQNADEFINRTGNFVEYGKPQYWRPMWAEAVCGLPATMDPNAYMPIRWNWTATDEEYFDTYWVSGWRTFVSPDTYGTVDYVYYSCPSQWYDFNTIRWRQNEGLSDDTHILAWRDGGVDGNIVHRVTRPNMELYATYVEKKLDENDDPNLATNPYDATNDDLIKLLNNKNYVQDKTKVPTHNLTVARKLQAGMYNTICLPLTSLNQDVLDLKTLGNTHPLYSDGNGQGATVLDFASVSSAQNSSGEDMTILNFTQVSEMQAGKPYLVKLKDGAEDLVTDMEFSTVSAHDELHDVPAEANGVKFTFVPTINPTTVPAGSLILVADNRLALTTKDGQMAGMRGYFTFSGLSAIDEEAIAEQAAEGRVLLNIKRPTATSVTVAPDSEKQNAPEVRKLMQDNQIYIIRDNAVYTITGQRVN